MEPERYINGACFTDSAEPSAPPPGCAFSSEQSNAGIVVIGEDDTCAYFSFDKLIDEEICLYVYDDVVNGPALPLDEESTKYLQKLLTSLKAAASRIEIELQHVGHI